DLPEAGGSGDESSMIAVPIYSQHRARSKMYVVYVPRDATVEDVAAEFVRIHLSSGTCVFWESSSGNSMWSLDTAARAFVQPANGSLHLCVSRDSIFNRAPKETEWNPSA
ncbi:hypothetical protein LPJ53_006510, partial [Coemansia erecta]